MNATPASQAPRHRYWRRNRGRIAARIAVTASRSRPTFSLIVVAAATVSGFVVAASWNERTTLAEALAWVVLAAAAATVAGVADPRQDRNISLLQELGLPPRYLRLSILLEVAFLIGPALVIGHIAAPGDVDDSQLLAGGAMALASAWFASRARMPAVLLPGRHRRRRVVRLSIACGLVVLGAVLPSRAVTGWEVDLMMALGLQLVFGGLLLAAGDLVELAGRFAARRSGGMRSVAAGLAVERSRAYAFPAALCSGFVVLVVVQSMVGVGLGDREARRRGELAQYTVQRGLSDQHLIVDTALATSTFLSGGSAPRKPADSRVFGALAGFVPHVAHVRAVAPLGSDDTRPNAGADLGDTGSDANSNLVGIATPELIDALRLDRRPLAEGRAIVLDPRRSLDGRTVKVYSTVVDGTTTVTTLRAVIAQRDTIASDLPAVLVAPRVARRLAPDAPRFETEVVVAGFGRRVTGKDRLAVERAVAGAIGTPMFETAFTDITRGDWRVRPGDHRTDEIEMIGPRNTDDVASLALAGGLVALTGLAVVLAAVAMAHRHEREVLEALGITRSGAAAMLAVQGSLVGLVGTVSGGLIGTAGTLFGLWRYNTHGRFDGEDLAAIPIRFPLALILTLAALPLVAGAVGWTIGFLRQSGDPVVRAQRLAW